jgi:hypothetical protein
MAIITGLRGVYASASISVSISAERTIYLSCVCSKTVISKSLTRTLIYIGGSMESLCVNLQAEV